MIVAAGATLRDRRCRSVGARLSFPECPGPRGPVNVGFELFDGSPVEFEVRMRSLDVFGSLFHYTIERVGFK
ncbi:hypothetical protein AArcSl_2347 [Halalkaliarchaeum desulfuricum]|uniref:Uncharacterized protein n=1 Tax=Halalkaliarchaeum desulfuricum TaxID=2055893 RepID=A0A343TLJ7_9EURY|nr:hypothetical protein [Halalkaliarchaeum desulfuricum]AUX09969.1 hypothetical protein AArcSl_2347 [Halalkaliarchaeum desulfuricum]